MNAKEIGRLWALAMIEESQPFSAFELA